LFIERRSESPWSIFGAHFLLTIVNFQRVATVYKLLRRFFPHNRELTYNWIWARNKGAGFGGKRPLDIMLHGKVSDMLLVRDYLELTAGQ
jgi:hypothetical protein